MTLEITRELQVQFARFNIGVEQARRQYAELPIAAFELDWCQACCYPRDQRTCEVCRAHMHMRELRAARKTQP